MPRFRVARLILPEHPLHGQSVDIVQQDGAPMHIEPASKKDLNPNQGDKNLMDAVAFAGWWDLQVDFRDPGTERAEGIERGLAIGAQGGFSRVAPVASTTPCRDHPSDIRALQLSSAGHVTGTLPLGALSAKREGIQLTEAHAMVNAGALGFSDDSPIERPELLRRALEYLAPLGRPVFSEAHDPNFQPDGMIHEGAVSTRLGLPGMSVEAELMRLRRDLDILQYSGGHLHVPVVTSAAGIEVVRSAKAQGLNVTCGTTVHHLCWTDEDLDGFNSDLKLSRPIRTASDRDGLREAALDGTLDTVVSDHRPRTPEEHDVDFVMVRPGIAALHAVGPALFGALCDHGASTERAMLALHDLLSAGPRRALGTPTPLEQEGGPQEFTFFSEVASLPKSLSKASNTVYSSSTSVIRGGVVGVVTPRGAHWN